MTPPDAPEDAKRAGLAGYRDLDGRGYDPWVRRGLLALLGIVVVAALLNVFR
jgi:hypothetical protein